jgi:phosphoglycerate dehydrogenase-like enzyme
MEPFKRTRKRDPPVLPTDCVDAFVDAQIVVLLLPLTDATTNILNDENCTPRSRMGHHQPRSRLAD